MKSVYFTSIFTRLSCVLLALTACGAVGQDQAAATGVSGGQGGEASGPGAGEAGDTGADDQMCGDFGQPCCSGNACKSEHLSCLDGACGQQSAGETGKPCKKNSDCESELCVPIGGDEYVCSSSCASSAACVAGWTCGAVVGQDGGVCECEAVAERCNGRDDDCSGIVDDEPAVGNECSGDLGDGAVCRGGSCGCDDAHGLCGDACVLLSSDPHHCGACDNACVPNATCESGACVCGGEMCDTMCVDPKTDENNCGQCGTKCPADKVCDGGECSCPAGQQACGNSCRDLSTDDDNCGQCGRQCSNVQSCEAGECSCPVGQQACGSSCRDLDTDENNCGGCGHTCPPSSACEEGFCESEPNYPFPGPGGSCPAGTILAQLDAGFAFCSPLCRPPDDSCPAATVNTVFEGCGLHERGSSSDCSDDSDCPGGEICYFGEFLCHAEPWGCGLVCYETADCPEGMSCIVMLDWGYCQYPYNP